MTRRSEDVLASGTAVTVTRPSGEPQRGVVLVPDIMGLRSLFDDLAERLADQYDWAVAAFEPWPGQEDLPADERKDHVRRLDDRRLLADATGAADLLGVEPVAVLGFCMGGMVALKAASLDRFDRAVSFYGMVRVPDAWRSPTMGDAIDMLTDGLAAKVLAIVGTEDPYVPASDAADLEACGGTVIRYEGAEHGFVHDPSRPTHRPDDAADAWDRAADWLQVARPKRTFGGRLSQISVRGVRALGG